MIKKIFLIFFFLNIFNASNASIKSEIINNFKKIDNISFDFKQFIDDKTEIGKCVIQYPKKINCKYDNLKKKIIVSNGSSLVIKHQNGKAYFRYLLKQTSLELILNKELNQRDYLKIHYCIYLVILQWYGSFFHHSRYELVLGRDCGIN